MHGTVVLTVNDLPADGLAGSENTLQFVSTSMTNLFTYTNIVSLNVGDILEVEAAVSNTNLRVFSDSSGYGTNDTSAVFSAVQIG